MAGSKFGATYRRRFLMEMICHNDQKPFLATRRDARFCSAKCRQAFCRYQKSMDLKHPSTIDVDTFGKRTIAVEKAKKTLARKAKK